MTDVAKARQNEKATADSQTAQTHWLLGGENPLYQDLTPWCRTLPENLTGLELVKKFPAFYGTRTFITAFTSARQLSLPSATAIQSMPPHPTSWRFVLILSFHIPRFYKWSLSFSHFIASLKPLFHWWYTKRSVRVCHLVNCFVAS